MRLPRGGCLVLAIIAVAVISNVAASSPLTRPFVAPRRHPNPLVGRPVVELLHTSARYRNARCYSVPALHHGLIATLTDVNENLFTLWMQSEMVEELPLSQARGGDILTFHEAGDKTFAHGTLVLSDGTFLNKRGDDSHYLIRQVGLAEIAADYPHARRQVFRPHTRFADYVHNYGPDGSWDMLLRLHEMEEALSGFTIFQPGAAPAPNERVYDETRTAAVELARHVSEVASSQGRKLEEGSPARRVLFMLHQRAIAIIYIQGIY